MVKGDPQLGEEPQGEKMTRREFIKLAFCSTAVFCLPKNMPEYLTEEESLKDRLDLFEILDGVPVVDIGADNKIFINGKENFRECEVSSYYKEPLISPLMIIVHYDGGPQRRLSGEARSVENTLFGLNGRRCQNYGPCVHFCVDGFPPNDELGILQSHSLEYSANHLGIGEEDYSSEKTVKNISNIVDYNPLWKDIQKRHFNDISVGIEQVGNNFAYNFPENYPSSRQISNLLGLTIALMEKYKLGIWEVVGHMEVQEKSDPSMEFMAIFRSLIVFYAFINRRRNPEFLSMLLERSSENDTSSLLKSIERYNDCCGDIYSYPAWRNEGKWKKYVGLDLMYEFLRRYSKPFINVHLK